MFIEQWSCKTRTLQDLSVSFQWYEMTYGESWHTPDVKKQQKALLLYATLSLIHI